MCRPRRIVSSLCLYIPPLGVRREKPQGPAQLVDVRDVTNLTKFGSKLPPITHIVCNRVRNLHNSSFDPPTLVVLEAAFDEARLTLKSIGNTKVKPDELARSVLRLARARPINVRFTPESGHWNSAAKCPLCAKSRSTHSPSWSIMNIAGIWPNAPPNS